jgi:hypothetical protein
MEFEFDGGHGWILSAKAFEERSDKATMPDLL